MTTSHTLQQGTFGFGAPEVFGFTTDSEVSPNAASVDMWSLGAVVFRMVTKAMPFETPGNFFKYASGALPFPHGALEAQDISKHGQNFILKLMCPDPVERPSANSATAHPWMTAALTPTGIISQE